MSASDEGTDRFKRLRDLFLALLPAGIVLYVSYSVASGDVHLHHLDTVTLGLNVIVLVATVIPSAFIALRRQSIERWKRLNRHEPAEPPQKRKRSAVWTSILLTLASPIIALILLWALGVYWFRRIFLWRGRISIATARRLRQCLLRDRKWRWYHFGIVPWLTVNSILFQIDRRAKKKVGDVRGIAAAVAVLEACADDADIRRLHSIWREFALLTPDEFLRRDRSYFMERTGVVLTEAAKVAILHALLMRPEDYDKLFGVACEIVGRQLHAMLKIGGIQSEILLYLFMHKKECAEKFATFRRDMLARARQYAENMMMFFSNDRTQPAAHSWYAVGEILVSLDQDLQPTSANEPAIREAVERLFERMSKAFAYTYLKYRELDGRGAPAQQPTAPTTNNPTPTKLPIFEVKKEVGRFKIDKNKHGLIIEDPDNPRGRQKRRYTKIHAPTVQRYFNEIFAKHDEGYDDFLLPGGNLKWRSSCKGEASDFINEEMETWTAAHPDATREEKHAHLGWYRIIPRGQPLKG